MTGGTIASHPPTPQKIAIVHDWLTGMRGGEKVLEAICELYPDATLYTLVRVQGSVSPRIERATNRAVVRRSGCPAAGRRYRQLPAALPDRRRAVRPRRLRSRHQQQPLRRQVGRSPDGPLHVCYCHSPMRYAWDQFDAYFGPASGGTADEPAAAAGHGRAWRGGTPRRPAGWTASSRTLTMLRAGSADTIIAGRPLCILL